MKRYEIGLANGKTVRISCGYCNLRTDGSLYATDTENHFQGKTLMLCSEGQVTYMKALSPGLIHRFIDWVSGAIHPSKKLDPITT